jgi:hypothetical protein
MVRIGIETVKREATPMFGATLALISPALMGPLKNTVNIVTSSTLWNEVASRDLKTRR